MGIENVLKRAIKIDVTPTPKEIAMCFCCFDSMQQAEFFNVIAEEVKTWRKANFAFQLQSITDEQMLTKEARYIMSQIGEYSVPF